MQPDDPTEQKCGTNMFTEHAEYNMKPIKASDQMLPRPLLFWEGALCEPVGVGPCCVGLDYFSHPQHTTCCRLTPNMLKIQRQHLHWTVTTDVVSSYESLRMEETSLLRSSESS